MLCSGFQWWLWHFLGYSACTSVYFTTSNAKGAILPEVELRLAECKACALPSTSLSLQPLKDTFLFVLGGTPRNKCPGAIPSAALGNHSWECSGGPGGVPGMEAGSLYAAVQALQP